MCMDTTVIGAFGLLFAMTIGLGIATMLHERKLNKEEQQEKRVEHCCDECCGCQGCVERECECCECSCKAHCVCGCECECHDEAECTCKREEECGCCGKPLSECQCQCGCHKH